MGSQIGPWALSGELWGDLRACSGASWERHCDPMRSKSSQEVSGGAPGISPGILSQLIYSHLHITENVVTAAENGYNILVSGVPESVLGPLGFPLSSWRSYHALKVLPGHPRAAQETSVVSKGFFQAPEKHPWEARSVETL